MLEELTEADIEQAIRDVFEISPALAPYLVESDRGPALRLVVESAAGPLVCIYPLRHASRALHGGVIDKGLARAILGEFTKRLAACVALGMEIGLDLARLQTYENVEAVISAEHKSPADPNAPTRSAERRDRARARIISRVNNLIPAKSPGRAARVKALHISAAIGLMLNEGVPLRQISAARIARRLKCSKAAVIEALQRDGQTFAEFRAEHKRE